MYNDVVSGFITLVNYGMLSTNVKNHADARFEWDNAFPFEYELAADWIIDGNIQRTERSIRTVSVRHYVTIRRKPHDSNSMKLDVGQ